MSIDTLEMSDTNAGPMLGFKVVMFDCHGREGPETVAGSIVFSHWLSLDDDLTLFTYRDVAIAIWNLSVALSDAGLLSWGIGWALAPEDGADPANCSSGDWPDSEHRVIAAAWQTLLDRGRTTRATSTCPGTSSPSRCLRAARNAWSSAPSMGRTTARGSPWLPAAPQILQAGLVWPA